MDYPKVKLEKIQTDNLDEIFQSKNIKFSLLHEKEVKVFEQVTVPGKCRDFLGDALWSKAMDLPVSIYNFKYKYKENPYDLDALKLSLNFPNKEVMRTFKQNLYGIIHDKEKQAGLKVRTTFFEVEGAEETLVVIASKWWLASPWRLSLYTYYLKLASYESLDVLEEPEDKYASRFTAEAEKIMLSKVKTAPMLFAKELRVNHNYSGFISVATNNCDAHDYMGDNPDYNVIFEGV